MAGQGVSDTKLVQYLNEAYGKEKELETALEAHIAMTTRDNYRKRLRDHLKETKAHARGLQSRIRQLGGKATAAPGPEVVAGAAEAVQTAANKALAAAQGPLHMLRGTGEQEKMLKNAKTEYFNEFEEIATYYAIETLADAVGDKETAKLARGIRKDEERMARFLERLIPQLAKGVAREEIPASERSNGRSRSKGRRSPSRRSTSRRSASGGSSRRSSASKARASSGGKSTSRRRASAKR